MTTTSTRRRRVALAVAASLTALALTACSLLDPVERDSETNEIIGGGTESAFALQVGDCFNDHADDEVTDLKVVPCAESHDNEVYHLFDLPDGDFPGEDAVLELADEGCFAAFEDFVGTAYEISEVDFYHLTPTRQGWVALSDREVACAVWDPEGPITGSLRDAGR